MSHCSEIFTPWRSGMCLVCCVGGSTWNGFWHRLNLKKERKEKTHWVNEREWEALRNGDHSAISFSLFLPDTCVHGYTISSLLFYLLSLQNGLISSWKGKGQTRKRKVKQSKVRTLGPSDWGQDLGRLGGGLQHLSLVIWFLVLIREVKVLGNLKNGVSFPVEYFVEQWI